MKIGVYQKIVSSKYLLALSVHKLGMVRLTGANALQRDHLGVCFSANKWIGGKLRALKGTAQRVKALRSFPSITVS